MLGVGAPTPTCRVTTLPTCASRRMVLSFD
jgi:hypothetical protein